MVTLRETAEAGLAGETLGGTLPRRSAGEHHQKKPAAE